MASRLPFSVGSRFESEACWDCPVQSKCAGGVFVVDLACAADDSKAIMESVVQVVTESFVSDGTMAVEEVADELKQNLVDAKQRHDQSVEAGNVLLKQIIKAHALGSGRVITASETYAPALEQFSEAPVDHSLLGLGTERAEQIASSIVHYADVGICGAIEVARND